MKTRIHQVPATTNNITLGVINYLNSNGFVIFRVNNTGVYDPIAQTFRKKAKNELGVCDIIGCSPRGFFIGIEIKNKFTKDKISKDQLVFHDRIKKAQGQIIIIREYHEIETWYRDYGQWL